MTSPEVLKPSSPRPAGTWSQFTGQLPAIALTVLLMVGALAWMFHRSAADERRALAVLSEQNEALRSQADENRRQIEATSQMLREAVGRHDAEIFKSDEEIQKLNGQRMDALADAIAKRVVPAIPGPRTPEDLKRAEDEQVDMISSRIVEKINPALVDFSQKQDKHDAVAAQTISAYNDRIQHLNDHLAATQAAAQDALKLSQEMSSLYLQQMTDHGVVARVLSLPAYLIKDTLSGNLLAGGDQRDAQKVVNEKLQQLETRLSQIQSQGIAAK
jgi:hypothetical protein